MFSHMRMLEGKCWPMLDEKFDRNQTLSNIVQHDPTLPNMVFKRRQHVVPNNVGWCCPKMLHPFKRAFTFCCFTLEDFWHKRNRKRKTSTRKTKFSFFCACACGKVTSMKQALVSTLTSVTLPAAVCTYAFTSLSLAAFYLSCVCFYAYLFRQTRITQS